MLYYRGLSRTKGVEKMESDKQNLIFKITGISTAVSLICWLVFSFLKPTVLETKVLSEDFLSTLKMSKIKSMHYAVMCGELNIGIYKTSEHTVP